MTKRITVLCIPLLLCIFATAQNSYNSLEFSLQKMGEDNYSWGVYIRPLKGFETPAEPVIATGQITILLRNNGEDDIEHIQSVNGNWNGAIEKIDGPEEAPDISYYFIGFIDSGNGVELENDKETLLLTLKLNNCPDTIALINNTIDPFAQLPNSVNNNPGMDFETFNLASNEIHNWSNNYENSAYNCNALSTSTSDAIELELLKLYPSPVEQDLQLEWTGNQPTQIAIFDLSNQIQLLATLENQSQQTIDVSQFPSGMYFLKIESEGRQYYSKFVKK